MKIRSVTRQRHRHHAARTRHPLDDHDISKKVRTKLEFEKKLNTLLSKKNNNSKYIKDKISYIGKKILKNTQKEINFFLENAI